MTSTAWPADQGPSNPPTSARRQLEESAPDWGVYVEGDPQWTLSQEQSPSLDGQSLKCSIAGGAPYSNAHCYRNLLDDGSRAFTLSLSFLFTPSTTFNNQGGESVIQALEFSISAWRSQLRYEWAMQWLNVGVGAPQWRYWDASLPAAERWAQLPTPIMQELSANAFHSLTIKGEIRNGFAHYRSFSIDGADHVLDFDAPPGAAPGVADKLAVAVQLDGNATETPYDVYLDRVSLARGSGADQPFPGSSLVDCSSLTGWSVEWDDGISPPVMSLADHPMGKAVRLDYDFLVPGSSPSEYGNWAQLRYDFSAPVDLSNGDLLRFRYLGGGAKNHLQVWLHDDTDNRVGIQIERVTDVQKQTEFAYYSLPYAVPSRGINVGIITPAGGWPYGDGTFDITHVKKLFFAVSRDTSRTPADVRSGSLEIGGVEIVDSVGRVTPPASTSVDGNRATADRCVQWLVENQGLTRPGATGLLTSWAEESPPPAHVYDQALALIAFTREGLLTQARALAQRLIALQNPTGSWYKFYQADTLAPDPAGTLWEGDVAWAAYALNLYWHATGEAGAHESAVKACQWLAGRIAARNADADPTNDGSVHNSTEANIDAWFAFAFTGGFETEADVVKQYLLTRAWDPARRRFCRGPINVDAGNAIDVHTWGSELLLWNSEPDQARDTLSYGAGTLPCASFDGTVLGLDGQGPFSVWFEGVGQWISARGWGGDLYLAELQANQEADGSLRNSPDDFYGEGVWLSRWHGVAPTAWCYFANTCPVFSQGMIRGTVFSPDQASAAQSGTVMVYSGVTGQPVAQATIHPDGAYVVAGLPEGDYVVQAVSGRYATRGQDRASVHLAAYTNLNLALQPYSLRQGRPDSPSHHDF
jgi:hypothetical protein